MFHLHDGWYFGRNEDGSVKIIKRGSATENAPVVFGTTVDADGWASVVSSVSRGGEQDYRFWSARKFHDSQGMVDIVPGNPSSST